MASLPTGSVVVEMVAFPFESSVPDPREMLFAEKATVPVRLPPVLGGHTLTSAVKVTLPPADCGFWLDVRVVVEQVSEDSKLNFATKAVPNAVAGAVVWNAPVVVGRPGKDSPVM